MTILFTIWDYSELGGSQLHVYELTKELTKLGHDCTIAAMAIGGEIKDKSIAQGVKVVQLDSLKYFDQNYFDLVHCHQNKTVDYIVDKTPFWMKPVIQTCHSEVLDIEYPCDSIWVDHYIAVRDKIKKMAIDDFGIPGSMVSAIYNPVDPERFNTENAYDDNFVLFAGSIDYLRKEALLETCRLAKLERRYVLVYGRNDYPELVKEVDNVAFMDNRFDIEQATKRCSWAAGIIDGRTGVEAIMCGKKYIDFIVDKNGNIKGSFLNPQNLPDYIINSISQRFHSGTVAKQTEQLYKKIIQNDRIERNA